MDELLTHLQRWERRRRWLRLGRWLPRGLLAGMMLAALVAAIARFRPWLTPEALLIWTVGLAGAGLLLAGIGSMLIRRSLVQQARLADEQFHLQERMITAVEIHLARLTPPAPWVELQLQDALQAARRVDVGRALPWRWPRQEGALLALTGALLILALVLPNPQTGLLRQQQAAAQAIEEQAAAVAALLEEIRQTPGLTPAQQEAVAAPLEAALQELQEGDLSQTEVVAVLSEAEADLRALTPADLATDVTTALAEAGAPLAQTTPAGAALGQALQTGDLPAAARAAFELADELPSLTPAEAANLAQQLQQAAAALAEVDSALAAELAAAAESLNQGDSAAAQAALRQAGALLQQRAGEIAAAQAADQLAAGRQAVAQAGQEASGTAGAPAEGSGEGATGGEAAGADNPAAGSDNASGSPGPGGGHVEGLFVPPSSPLADAPGVPVELPAICQGDPEACGQLVTEQETPFRDEQSHVPYDQVFGDYRDRAYATLADDYVPLGLKDYIRDYFSSLEP